MKLFLFFIGSSFATTCFKCRATTMEESQVSTTPPSSLPSLISGRVSFVLLFYIEWHNIISEAIQNRLRIYVKTHKQKQTALDWRKIVLTQNLRLNVTAGAIQFHIFLSVSFFACEIPEMSLIKDFTEKLTVRSNHMSIILSVDARGIVILYFMVKLLWLNRTLTGDPLP